MALHIAGILIYHVVQLGVDHRLRDLHGGVLYNSLYYAVLILRSGLFLLRLRQFRSHVSLVLLQGLKLGNLAGKLIV